MLASRGMKLGEKQCSDFFFPLGRGRTMQEEEVKTFFLMTHLSSFLEFVLNT